MVEKKSSLILLEIFSDKAQMKQVGADAWNPALDIQKAKYCKAIYLFPKALSAVFLSQKASEY